MAYHIVLMITFLYHYTPRFLQNGIAYNQWRTSNYATCLHQECLQYKSIVLISNKTNKPKSDDLRSEADPISMLYWYDPGIFQTQILRIIGISANMFLIRKGGRLGLKLLINLLHWVHFNQKRFNDTNSENRVEILQLNCLKLQFFLYRYITVNVGINNIG